MPNIFGDTDDITFGGTKNPPSPRPIVVKTERERSVPLPQTRPSQARPPQTKTSTHSSFAPRRVAPTHDRRVSQPNPPETPTLSKNLKSLIDSMKPSFLPNMPESIMRFVLLSPASHGDPMMLVRTDDVTLIFGTGFASHENVGRQYPTFPDMRLVASEQDRLAGWVLTTPGFDLSLFQALLEMLGFPFVYGTRDVIAYIRNNVTDAGFLEKCRFFELFTTGSHERKIAQFTLSSTDTGLVIQTTGKSLIDTLHSSSDFSGASSASTVLGRENDRYTFGSEAYQAGEIIDMSPSGKLSKQSLKFTFDTFFVDAFSIGVIAGYTLKDRSELASSGVLTFVIEEDIRIRAIVGHIFIDSRGFVHSYEMMSVHKEILKAIRHVYETALIANPSIERGELVSTLRREVTKYCYLLTGRTPVVMPVIIER